MKFKQYGNPWYFAIKGAMFLLISALSFIQISGSLKILGFLSSAFILAMAFAVFGNRFIAKSKKEKIIFLILGLCHLAFACIIFFLTIKRGSGLETTEQAEMRALTFFWIRNWFAFFLLTEWLEAIRLWTKKNAHCITIFMDSIMTAIFLVVFSYLKNYSSDTPITFYDMPLLFLAIITLLAGLGTIATSVMLNVCNNHSNNDEIGE